MTRNEPIERREKRLQPRLLGQMSFFLSDSDLVAGAGGATVLLILVFVLKIALSISFVLAIGVYCAIMLIIPASKPRRLIVEGSTDSDFRQFLTEALDGIAKIAADSERVETATVRERAHAIAAGATRIVDALSERPRLLADVRFAFDTLLRATRTALDRHRRFSAASGPAARRAVRALESRVLPTIGLGLRQLEDRLLHDDVRALDVDLAVLEEMLSLEGLARREDDSDGAPATAGIEVEPAQTKETP